MDREHKIDLRGVEEGDTVTMNLSAHNFEASGVCLTGEITELPSDDVIEMLHDGKRPMADVTVTGSETGVKWTWNIDNGYVIGPVEADNRPDRSDIGKIQGFFDPEARNDFEKAYDAGIHENVGEHNIENGD